MKKFCVNRTPGRGPDFRGRGVGREQDRPDKAEAGNYSLCKFKLGLAVPAERVTNVSPDARLVTVIAHGSPTTWR